VSELVPAESSPEWLAERREFLDGQDLIFRYYFMAHRSEEQLISFRGG
jgi:hypothetical protein